MGAKPKKKAVSTKRSRISGSRTLFNDIRQMIDDARSAVAVAVNAGLTMLHWNIGRRINEGILQGARAEYGEKIVSTLSRQLIEEYGERFQEKYLRRMVQFSQTFPDERIVVSLIRQLSWTHFKELAVEYARQRIEGRVVTRRRKTKQ